MADDTPDPTPPDTQPPALITPLESGYIRIAIGAALPAINWVVYATNLDQVLHITALTTNQVWQAVNAALTVASVVLVILKRIREGKDPKSTAARIVMSKPEPVRAELVPPPFVPQAPAPPVHDELAAIAAAKPTAPGPPHMTDEELLAMIQQRMKKPPAPQP